MPEGQIGEESPWILRGLSAEVTQTASWLTPNQLSIVDLTPSPLSPGLRIRRPGGDTIDSITLKTRVCRTRQNVTFRDRKTQPTRNRLQLIPPLGHPPRESRSIPIPTRFVGLVVRGYLRALGHGLRYAVREIADHHHVALEVVLQRGNRVQARRAVLLARIANTNSPRTLPREPRPWHHRIS